MNYNPNMSEPTSFIAPDKKKEMLKNIDVLSFFHESTLERLAQESKEIPLKSDTIVFEEGDPGNAMYIVLEGEILIHQGEKPLTTMLPGTFFGEMSLIDDEPRSAHVIAMESSDLLVLRRDDFQRCLDETPRIAIGLLRALTRRLRLADSKIGGLVLLDVTGRVARILLEMADENDGVVIQKKVTHHQIAQMIGSSRETVSRTMRTLAEENLIEMVGKTIKVRNREAMEAAAGLR